MGDPECQTILPRLKTDFLDIVVAVVNENLKNINLEWFKEKSICVVLCSKGYPEKYEKNVEIKNLDKIELNSQDFLFHAGTIEKEGKFFSVGGRVLNFISLLLFFTMSVPPGDSEKYLSYLFVSSS